MKSSTERIYGFYSDQHAHLVGTTTWIGADGKETIITGTSSSEYGTGYGFSDSKFCGQVLRMVRRTPAEGQMYGEPIPKARVS